MYLLQFFLLIKKILYQVLENLLTPIREKRKYYEERMDLVNKILKDGTINARKDAHETLRKVKNSININYFDE